MFLKSGTSNKLLSTLVFNIVLKALTSTIRQVKVKIKGAYVKKKDIKLYLFIDHMIYVENLNNLQKHLQDTWQHMK